MKTIRFIAVLMLLITMANSAWASGVKCKPSDIGRVVCTDGSIYNSAWDAGNAGKTVVGMIGYIDWNTKKAVAIALSYYSYSAPQYWEMDGTPGPLYETYSLSSAQVNELLNSLSPVLGSTWRLPTVDEWKHMLIAAGSTEPFTASEFEYSEFRNKLRNAGGPTIQENESHWTGSTTNASETCVTFTKKNKTVTVGNALQFVTYYYASFSSSNQSSPKRLLPCLEFSIEYNLDGFDGEVRTEANGSKTLIQTIESGTNEGQLKDRTELFFAARGVDGNAELAFSLGGDAPIARITFNNSAVNSMANNDMVKFGARYTTYEDAPGEVHLVFDFRLEDNAGTPINLSDGTATVTMPYADIVPDGKTPAVWCYNRTLLMEEAINAQFNTSTKVLTFTVSSF